ncbi:MAG: hypothetical protein MJK13_17420 [Pseudomonadales bacterium]|nr:hypothetical protein [Pseudomonadales bacterium]
MISTRLSDVYQQTTQTNAGYLVLLGIIFSLIGSFYPQAIIVSAILYWLASFKQRLNISSRNARQSLVLVGIGLSLAVIAFVNDSALPVAELLQGNVFIVSMLAGVSFLTVISQPSIDKDESLPRGKRTILSTYLGVHLFGAVINISSLFIHADRMTANRSLSRSQVMVLTRGFSAAAFWSPFFAAMAVALSYAPQANLMVLMLAGAALAMASMLITFRDVNQTLTESVFYGYPLRLGSLWLPTLLTILVFLIHHLYPELSILFIITLCSPLICLLLVVRKKNRKEIVVKHIETKLANMQNEIVLFLSAGVFAFGLKMILANQDFIPMFEQFNGVTASACFVLIVLLSMLGFHMLIGVSIVAPLVLPLNPDPSLLAVVILASWALGSAVGPLSGMNISIQASYGVDSKKILAWNFRYVCIMALLVILVINILDNWVLL